MGMLKTFPPRSAATSRNHESSSRTPSFDQQPHLTNDTKPKRGESHMPIYQNPANTRLASDLKIYRRKITNPSPKNPDTDKEIRAHLHKRNPGKYADKPPGGKNDDILTGEAYRAL